MQAKMVGSIWIGGNIIEENNLMNRQAMKSICTQTMHPYNLSPQKTQNVCFIITCIAKS